ncbi:DUF805 domain-containing protein [Akkermansia sp.]|uniref:DUF805 domain-containing protein n=1 Tax=Akkermansia sp. TaxID=1872421 RepID=UPI003AB1885A
MERRGMFPGNHATPMFIFNPKDRSPVTYKKKWPSPPSPARSLFTPGLSVRHMQRLHGANKSGMLLLSPVPLIGRILFFIYCCENSRHGTNQSGPSQKHPEFP